MKKIITFLVMTSMVITAGAPLPQPNSQEFGILLASTTGLNMPLFGFTVSGTPYNQSFSYYNISSSQLMIPQTNGYYIGLTYDAVKNWDGTFVYEFDTNPGKIHTTGKVDKKYIKAGGLIRIIFSRKLNNDKYEYSYIIQDLTGLK